MYTAAGIASQIVTAIVTEFSQANRIDPGHLLEDTDSLTAVEVMTAGTALGMWKTEPPHETVYDEQAELDPEPWRCGLGGNARHTFARDIYCPARTWEPRPGYEQRPARYGVAS